MTNIAFNTLKFSEQLRKAGATEEYAKAEAEALLEVFSEALDTSIATKSDIERLDAKIDKQSMMIGILIALAVANFAKQFF